MGESRGEKRPALAGLAGPGASGGGAENETADDNTGNAAPSKASGPSRDKLDPGQDLERRSHVQDTWDSEAAHESYADKWQEAGLLDAPPARSGFEQTWVRTKLLGVDDPENIARRNREGWKPRSPDTVSSSYPLASIVHGRFAGFIGVEGMVLMERPKWLHRRHQQQVREQAAAQMQAVRNNLFKVRDPNDTFGRIEMSDNTRVSLKRRPVAISEDEASA